MICVLFQFGLPLVCCNYWIDVIGFWLTFCPLLCVCFSELVLWNLKLKDPSCGGLLSFMLIVEVYSLVNFFPAIVSGPFLLIYINVC